LDERNVQLEKEKAEIQEELDEIKAAMELIGECGGCGEKEVQLFEGGEAYLCTNCISNKKLL
jgi:hypothetical protein